MVTEPRGLEPPHPVVTVGVPVRNGEEFLERALRALQGQELTDIEVLVADNASTDDTRKIAEMVAAEDSRFRYLGADSNGGIPWNWNRLLAHARAPYFMWNSADDIVLPTHLSSCVRALESHPDATIAFSRVVLSDSDDKVVGSLDDEGIDFLSLRPSARVGLFFERQVWQVIGFGGVFRTETLRGLGGLPDYWGGDFGLAVAMALRAPWVQVPEIGFIERRHVGQMTNLQTSDPVAQTRVYRPRFGRSMAFPQWYLHGRVLAEAVRAPVPVLERARAISAVVRRWTIPGMRSLGYDIKRNLQRLADGRVGRAS
ncbi:glycosyltransferase family 2 protein [Isoptericola croceus]|uniref:glycosyltransferase family 2 protein n=1 Tax=Isoptericola croceus TaxID=3031406 RepID=UPI0023F71E00|nr:glycosyltransferase family 2 protein [Isoptericola croceus]